MESRVYFETVFPLLPVEGEHDMTGAESESFLDEIPEGERGDEMDEAPIDQATEQICRDMGLDSRRGFLGACFLGGGMIALDFMLNDNSLHAADRVDPTEVAEDRAWTKGYFNKTIDEGQKLVKQEPRSKNRLFGIEKLFYGKEVRPNIYDRIYPVDRNKKSKWTSKGKECSVSRVRFVLFQPARAVKNGAPIPIKGAGWYAIGFQPSGVDINAYETNKDGVIYSRPVRPKLSDAESAMDDFGANSGYQLVAAL